MDKINVKKISKDKEEDVVTICPPGEGEMVHDFDWTGQVIK